MPPFVFVSPATRGLGLALVRHYLRNTSLPVFCTYRPEPPSEAASDHPVRTEDTVRDYIMQPLADKKVDPSRLRAFSLDLTSEESIALAADTLASVLSELSDTPSYIRIAFFLGGILYPERQPADLVLEQLLETFKLNTISHLLLIKHFSRFLPPVTKSPSPTSESSSERLVDGASANSVESALAKWVHVSARVGSISDNRLGGWYSYRASKAALNQVIRTFDLHLQAKKMPAMCVGVHPGTVKTDLSKAFWKGVPAEKLFEPNFAAQKLAEVVEHLRVEQRGQVWDWKGELVKP